MKLGIFVNTLVVEGAIPRFDYARYATCVGASILLYAPEIERSEESHLWVPTDLKKLGDAEWWHDQQLQLAIFYFGGGPFPHAVLRLAKESGATVVIECDSDGYVSPLQSPIRRLLLRHLDDRLSFAARLRSTKAWADGLIFSSREREYSLFQAFGEADFIKIESQEPGEILRNFFRTRGRLDLAERVVVIPFPVRECFSQPAIPEEKEPIVLVAGRLEALQKGPVETLEVLCALSKAIDPPQVELHIRGQAVEFERLAASQLNIKLFYNSTPELLSRRMRTAQILFSRSRWETTPVVGLEALCSGCTLVAPRELPGYRSLVMEGKFGRLYGRNDVKEAVVAIRSELDLWAAGQRDQQAMASDWRGKASMAKTIEELRKLLLNKPRGTTQAERIEQTTI